MARPSEDELIARYFAPLAGPGGLGLADDAALLVPEPGHDLVLTVDTIVAGVHFLPDDPPDTIGPKALGVNLSDLAAKGARPVGFLLALALPDDWTADWLAAFAGGLGAAAAAADCPLLGGDTVRMPGPLTISVTAFGAVPAGRMVRRTTARPGDLVGVTGTIGDAALGLALLGAERGQPSPGGGGSPAKPAGWGDAPSTPWPPPSSPDAGHPTPRLRPDPPPPGEGGSGRFWASALDAADHAFLLDRYRRPRPRLALAPALRDHASAAMDVSDGLAGDLAKMLRASGVAGTLDLDRVPLSPAARAALAAEPALLDRVAGGGDDYEILFTLPPDRWDAMARAAAGLGLAVTAIGAVRAGDDPLSCRLNGMAYGLAAGSFQHFGEGSRPVA